MYIYHNKELDEYYFHSNLTKLCDATGIKYSKVSHVFSRRKEFRYNGNGFVIVKRKIFI